MICLTNIILDIFLAEIFLIIATTAQQQNAKNLKKETIKTNVLVLGAGVSGISAASTLYKQNVRDFVVVEAQSSIGGRAKVVEWDGFTIETGANWIHHINENDSQPLLKLKKMLGLQGTLSNYSDIHIR